MRLIYCLIILISAIGSVPSYAAETRPNIVWIVVEDMSTHFGCYGETSISTPHVDALSKSGVKFDRAYVTAPVCSTCRSAMVTGMYQTSIGAHHHRSGRGRVKIALPDSVKLIPQLFREAGYWSCNLNQKFLKDPKTAPNRTKGKTDYNFEWDQELTYNVGDWSHRKPGQPFFAQIQLHGGKGRTDDSPRPVKNSDVKLPVYYPNDPTIINDWRRYLNSVINTDEAVGKIVARLKQEGEYKNTYIFFITDHGISHARGKQFCYEEGMRIPFIVAGPKVKAGTTRDDLIVHIDMAATSLALAGIKIPEYLQSVDLFAADYQNREFIVSARDRCDETVDRIRGLVTSRYKYIRNGLPQRPYLQPNRYKDDKPIIKAMRRLHKEGTLNEAQSLIMAQTRPAEELYDLQADANELHNLAVDPKSADVLAALRGKLDQWIESTGDLGQQYEPESAYDSDMDLYAQSKPGREEQTKIILKNIALMKQWKSEGK
jgi:arylsulfatase A-like enzyme